jgi:alpha-2-macroglobulin
MLRQMFLFCSIVLVLTACQTAVPTPTPLAAITATATATNTPTAVPPSPTPSPTNTPSPTATDAPTLASTRGTTAVLDSTTAVPDPATAVLEDLLPTPTPSPSPSPTALRPPTVNIAQSDEQPLSLAFNAALDHTFALAALTISPRIAGEWTAKTAADQTTLSLRPATALPAETSYTISFGSGLLAADGRLLPPPTPLTVQTPRLISRVDPSPMDSEWGWYYGISPFTNITIAFTREMNQAAVERAFQISPPVEGFFSWDGNTLTFQPLHGYLQGFTRYTVTLAPTLRDAAGSSPLNQPYRWEFYTHELQTAADFGRGAKVQLLDADGRRAIQYRSFATEPISVTFRLYSLDQDGARLALQGDKPAIQSLPQVGSWTAVTAPREPEDTPYSWGHYLNPQETSLPADLPPGPYLLSLDAEGFHDELLLFLSRHTLAVKQADRQLLVWATEINGAPAPTLEISLWDDAGREVANGRSDPDGLFQTILPPDVTPAFVLARQGDDLVVSGFNATWGRSYYAPPLHATLGHISTDRPIYRPGHTIYFKAFLRHDADAALRPLEEGTAVTAQLRDSRGNLVHTFTLAANHFGAVDGQFQLADGSALGEYQVQITAPDGRIISQPLKVEEYRKPDYEVTVSTDADRYLTGDTISVTVESAYFFGEPVANAPVQVYLFSRSNTYYWSDWNTSDAPINGQTDDNGRFTFTLTPNVGQYMIEATIDDGSHQSVSGLAAITVYGQAENLSLDLGSYLKEPGAPVQASATARDIFGHPVANRQVNLSLRHYDPDTGNMVVVDTFRGQTEGNGRYTFIFTPPEVGYYDLIARATDRLGVAISDHRYFFVYNQANRFSRWFNRSDSLTITSSQEQYAPGDTAQLFIQSDFAGPALLTLERAAIHRQQRIELTPPLTVIELPIRDSDTPNIFASVIAWKANSSVELGSTSLADSQLLVAAIDLPISLAHKTLNVTISPDKAQYRPGDEATFTLQVTNQQGIPVSAELSLAVVDEAIFSLSPDLTPDMLDTFYFKRYNRTRLFHSLYPSRSLWYEGEPGGMGGGGDDALETGQPRREFEDTAAWFPTLRTDAAGLVSVTVKLPDNLTSWRLTARAFTADTQVGEAVENVTTWQPVIVRPILPRALTAGDDLILTALLHNYTTTAQSLTVTLSIHNSPFTIHHSPFHTLSLPPGSSQAVGWPLTAVTPGPLTLTIHAAGPDGLLDAVELPLTIRPLAVPDVAMQTGQFSDSFTTEIDWPAEALSLSSVQLDISRSIAGSLVQGLEFLTGYPYGCVEQTMSRALPNAVVARAFRQLGVSDPALLANLEPLVQASVQRLYGFQHSDGGWGWWTNDPSTAYQTAWVLFGLVTTAEAGYAIDPDVIQRGADWLTAHLAEMDPQTRAFALYALALAGQGERLITLAAAEQSAGLDVFSRAALALALAEMGETAVARELVDALAETAVVRNGAAHWPGERYDGYFNRKSMASATRSTALALSAFAQIRPGHELEPLLARYLMNQRQPSGWGSTNETAFTILALTDHLLRVQSASGPTETNYAISLNGQTILSGTLAVNTLTARLDLPADTLQPGRNTLAISHNGPLYYTLNRRVYLPQAEIEAAGDVRVTRVYEDGLTGEKLTAFVPNQLIRVTLTVHLPDAAAYVIIEDSLPGGLEALNENLANTTRLAGGDERPSWRWPGYDYKETRDDRVSFFVTEMAAGRHTFSYLARATHVGDFVAMPAEVYAMYDLTVWGRSASDALRVAAE